MDNYETETLALPTFEINEIRTVFKENDLNVRHPSWVCLSHIFTLHRNKLKAFTKFLWLFFVKLTAEADSVSSRSSDPGDQRCHCEGCGDECVTCRAPGPCSCPLCQGEGLTLAGCWMLTELWDTGAVSPARRQPPVTRLCRASASLPGPARAACPGWVWSTQSPAPTRICLGLSRPASRPQVDYDIRRVDKDRFAKTFVWRFVEIILKFLL